MLFYHPEMQFKKKKMLLLISALQKCCETYSRVSSEQALLVFSKASWVEREDYQAFQLQQQMRTFI